MCGYLTELALTQRPGPLKYAGIHQQRQKYFSCPGQLRPARGWSFRRCLLQMCCVTMRSTHLSTWITQELKSRFAALAASRGVSDSALLKQLIELAVMGATPELALTERPVAVARDARITIRLVSADRLLLRERAAARGMRAASYVSTLTRAHLRSLSPLPDREIEAMQAIAVQLSAMCRNIRTIALTSPSAGLTPDHTRTMLKLCEATRDYVRGLMSANIRSWENGHDETVPRA